MVFCCWFDLYEVLYVEPCGSFRPLDVRLLVTLPPVGLLVSFLESDPLFGVIRGPRSLVVLVGTSGCLFAVTRGPGWFFRLPGWSFVVPVPRFGTIPRPVLVGFFFCGGPWRPGWLQCSWTLR